MRIWEKTCTLLLTKTKRGFCRQDSNNSCCLRIQMWWYEITMKYCPFNYFLVGKLALSRGCQPSWPAKLPSITAEMKEWKESAPLQKKFPDPYCVVLYCCICECIFYSRSVLLWSEYCVYYTLGLRFLVRLCTDMGMKEMQEYATKLKRVEKLKELREQV